MKEYTLYMSMQPQNKISKPKANTKDDQNKRKVTSNQLINATGRLEVQYFCLKNSQSNWPDMLNNSKTTHFSMTISNLPP
jgi:hypothetical protein